MKHKEQHDGLTRLGEELLKEFEAAEKAQVSPEFDREWRGNLSRGKNIPLCRSSGGLLLPQCWHLPW